MHEDSPPVTGSANRLQNASSSYLRHALRQPVQWHSWGKAAFARAQAEDKPILLDIGAVWCHWCHVMDRESYDDPEIAQIINEHFVAIKVDRDELPDVDARYQAAVSAISGQGGWPLTAFLTPDGRPYFGGTYFPRTDRLGQPGFVRVLQTMASVWLEKREEALDSAASVMAAIEQNEAFAGGGEELSPELLDTLVSGALRQFDPRNGGFGTQPKFPHPAMMNLLLQVAMNRGDDEARAAFETTLEKMARGGVYDHLAGGFHRYSVDERWGVPHFEKMLYDNTELLRNYLHGFQSLARRDFQRTATEIIQWLDDSMTDREHGGFYSSQDADIDLDDDGDYFTWTLDEIREALDPDEAELAIRYWTVREVGDMRRNPAKNVLHVRQPLEEIALHAGTPVDELRRLLQGARVRLLKARKARRAPFVDQTLYTGWNAMAVSAYLEAARVLRIRSAHDFALRTLTRLLAQAWDGGKDLAHVIAYGLPPAPNGAIEQAPGTLDDYAFTVHACLDAWFAAGKMEFYRAAIALADAMIERFYDRDARVFYDVAVSGGRELGALSARRKPIQDTPTPAGNPVAAGALLRLEALSGLQVYRQIAKDTLGSFAGVVGQFGLYAGSYGLALERLLRDPLQVVVVGSGPEALRLEGVALARYAINKTVMRIAPHRLSADGIPGALAEVLLNVPAPEGAEVWALVCHGRSCQPPVTDAEGLLRALEAQA